MAQVHRGCVTVPRPEGEVRRASEPRTVRLGGGLEVPYPEPSSPAATKIGRGNRRRDTRPEVELRSALHRSGLRFRKDHRIDCDGRSVRADVVFTRWKVAVFVDGCFWHGCLEHQRVPKSNRDYWVPKLRRNVERDRQVDEALTNQEWVVVRIWEHEEVEGAARTVLEVVAYQRGMVGIV